MKEKPRDLNLLRDAMIARRSADALKPLVPERETDAVNTLEQFEALPLEQQLARMREKEYTDLEYFKQRHYRKGQEVRVDINKLREQANQIPMSPELKAAEAAFLKAELACEVVSRGAGLEPYLKIKLPEKDVYIAHHYDHIVSTDRIPGFNTSTAGLGEFEYYVQI